MKTLTNGARLLLAACLVLVAIPAAWAQEAPDVLVKRVANEVQQIVRSDPKVQAGDQQRIRDVIETKLLPNFDFERMTALAMGRNWRQATPEQQKLLIDQKLSKSDKEKVWVLESNKKIIWVIGHRIDDRCKLTDRISKLLHISYLK